MISIYTGTPGSGKSLHAASLVRRSLGRFRPRPVLGNFRLADDAPVVHPELFHYWPNDELTPELLTDWCYDWWDAHPDEYREDGILLIFDEAQLVWNSRRWSDKSRLAWLELMSQHRKAGAEIILIAQSDKMIDNQFRMLIEYEVIHRKFSNFGFWGGLLSLLFGGRLFGQIYCWYQTHEVLSADWYVARKKDMAMYDTRARFERKEI